jgi:endonuclease/exonuclease/phosphatase family metal-dependent hydrolase
MLYAQEFTVASFNIRNPSDKGDNAWTNRIPRIKYLIQKGGIDLIGLQEATDPQCEDLLSPEWARFGVCRDDGARKGESSSIFYRKDRFDFLRGGNFWLSETPEVPGSMSWKTYCTRLCTWAELRLRDDSHRTFFVFNTHLDHRSEEAKINGMKLILTRIRQIVPSTADCILTGDLNSAPDSATVRMAEECFKNTRTISETPPTGGEATVNGFRLNREPKGRIDYVFVSENMRVLSYATLNERVGGFYPSDHFPVAARIHLK